MSIQSLTPSGWQQMIQAQQQGQAQQQASQTQQNQAISQNIYNGTLGVTSGTSYYSGGVGSAGSILTTSGTGSIYWTGAIYTTNELKLALNEDLTFTYNSILNMQGRLVKVDGGYCEIKEGRNHFVIMEHNITSIPVIDKMKESKLYKLAVPPVEVRFFGGLTYGSTGTSLTYNTIQNAIIHGFNTSGQP